LDWATHHWPLSLTRPAILMMGRPVRALVAPVKSPTLTSTQVTAGLHVVQRGVGKEVPVGMPNQHWPVFLRRAAKSALPLPLKSPVTTSTQVTLGLQVSHRALLKAFEPLDCATHHCPDCETRPAMSWTWKFPAKALPLAVLPPTSVTVTVKTWESEVR